MNEILEMEIDTESLSENTYMFRIQLNSTTVWDAVLKMKSTENILQERLKVEMFIRTMLPALSALNAIYLSVHNKEWSSNYLHEGCQLLYKNTNTVFSNLNGFEKGGEGDLQPWFNIYHVIGLVTDMCKKTVDQMVLIKHDITEENKS